MKRKFLTLLLFLSVLLTGCIPGNHPTEPTSCPTGNSPPAMVRINGREYHIWFEYSDLIPSEDEICGTITSVTEYGSPFTADDQANFSDALGKPYAIVDGQMLLRIKWMRWVICDPVK